MLLHQTDKLMIGSLQVSISETFGIGQFGMGLHQYRRLDRRVSPKYIVELRRLGFKDFEVDDLVELGRHDISPKFIAELNRLGLKEHPLAAFYSDERPGAGLSPKEQGHAGMFAFLKRARQKGETIYFDTEHVGCFGGPAIIWASRQSPGRISNTFFPAGFPGRWKGSDISRTRRPLECILPLCKPERLRENTASSNPLTNFPPRTNRR